MKSLSLIHIFIGFGSDVTNMLRPEFFKDVSGSKAKFDGPSVLYNLKYNTSNGFMYMAVSYTHLDVYKRQNVSTAKQYQIFIISME